MEKPVRRDSSKKKPVDTGLNFPLLSCLALLLLFFIYSGGEILGFIAVILYLYSSYLIARCILGDVTAEKLFFVTLAIFFSLVSAISFILLFFGFRLLVNNYLLVSLILSYIVFQLTRNKIVGNVNIDSKRIIKIGLCFIISFFVYLWPSLPGFTVPTGIGYDGSRHIEYAMNIYVLGYDIPLGDNDLHYYPTGFHANVALLSHAFESHFPSYNCFIYPFVAFVSALIVAILCTLAMERLRISYILLFLIAILTSLYPLTALIEYGFWSMLFCIYLVMVFVLITSDFLKNRTILNLSLMLFLSFGMLASYHLIYWPFIVVFFLWSVFTIMKAPFFTRITIAACFAIALFLIYAVYTMDGYAKFLLLEERTPTLDYLGDLMPSEFNIPCCARVISLADGEFRFEKIGLRLDSIYSPPERKIGKLLSDGFNLEKFGKYVQMGRAQLLSEGWALYLDVKWFGLLTLLFFFLGLLYRGERDLMVIFFESSVLTFLLSFIEFNQGLTGRYYFLKGVYFFVYPAILCSVFGLSRFIEDLQLGKYKIRALFVVILLLTTLYAFNLVNKDTFGLLFGERRDLFQENAYKPLLEFNRFLRWWESNRGVKSDSYGFFIWLNNLNKVSIKEWLLCGPFQPNDFDETHGFMSEPAVNPKAGDACGRNTWSDYSTPDNSGSIDFNQEYGTNGEPAVVFAATYLYSPEAKNVEFQIGSDDTALIWLNNVNVPFNQANNGGETGITNKITLNLNPGWNTLLIRIVNNGGAWMLHTRIDVGGVKTSLNHNEN